MGSHAAHRLTLAQTIEVAQGHHMSGRFADAATAYQHVLSVVHNSLGNVFRDSKRETEAEAAFRQAIAFRTSFVEAHNNLAATLIAQGRLVEAEISYRQAIAIEPDFAIAHNNLGNVLKDLGHLAEAESAFRQAVFFKPDFAIAHANLGNALMDLGRPAEAEAAYRQAITHKPDYAMAHNNLGITLKCLGRLSEAETVYRHAIALQPQLAMAHNNLGVLLHDFGRLDEAEQAYRQAISLQPGYARAKWNLSLLELLKGNFEKGSELYELRFEGEEHKINKTSAFLDKLAGYDRWHGESLQGRSMLLISEQGAGDNLMMMRYIPLLKKMGLKLLTVYCFTSLRQLMQCMPDVDDAVPVTDPLPFGRFDLFCPIMSLPYLFQTRLETIPNEVPYLKVPKISGQAWRERLDGIHGIKVGLVWAGGKITNTDARRSIPLAKFEPLLAIDGVSWVSLQKGEESLQLKELGWNFHNRMDECNNFLDTAALVDQLDLVISVDTSVAHLAGALGKPVWLLNRYESEWRWLLDRTDSPWYPTMRIFRQAERGDWDKILKRVSEELLKLLACEGDLCPHLGRHGNCE